MRPANRPAASASPPFLGVSPCTTRSTWLRPRSIDDWGGARPRRALGPPACGVALLCVASCASGVLPTDADDRFAGGFQEDGYTAGETAGSDTGDGVEDGGGSSGDASEGVGQALDDGPRPPRLLGPTSVLFHEEEEGMIELEIEDRDGDDVRVWLTDLPPGAFFDESTRRLSFTPDFTQGGDSYTVGVTLDDGLFRVETSVQVEIADDITPPSPEIRDEWVDEDGIRWLEIVQVTDTWLDPPALAGREVSALVAVPPASPAQRFPVRVSLHSYGGVPSIAGWYEEIRVAPHDPDDTYWWGIDTDWPDGVVDGDDVPATTQRRVLHLLDFLLEELPEADSERVYTSGSSMGGTGALALGLRHARHFAAARGSWSMTMPRHHRPERITQLSSLWGSPETAPEDPDASAWDAQDVSWLLSTSREARETWVGLHLAKDDPNVHFSALVAPSFAAGLSPLDALQVERVAHFVVWDEAGHGGDDPELGEGWWGSDLSPIHAETAFVRRDRPFVAFSHASHDGDPGSGGNGFRPWSPDTGFAGDPAIVGDTGWAGDRAGALNRHLEWDGAEIIDGFDELHLRLRVRADARGPGPAPSPGADPVVGDVWTGPLPVTVDVTPRRLRRFACRSGETLVWSFGASSGTVTCDAGGRFTIPSLALFGTWQTLVIARAS